MISKNSIKLIKSLALKKIRLKENLFLVEGDKIVSEVLESKFKVDKLFATSSFLINNQQKIKNVNLKQVLLLLDKISKVVVMVLVVGFFQKAGHTPYNGALELFYLALSITALSVGLYFLSKVGHHE